MPSAIKTNLRVIELARLTPEELIQRAQHRGTSLGDFLLGLLLGFVIGVVGSYLAIAIRGSL